MRSPAVSPCSCATPTLTLSRTRVGAPHPCSALLPELLPSFSISSWPPLPPPLCSTSTGPVPRPCPSVHSCLHNSPGAMALFPLPCFSLDLSFPLEFADSTCSHRTMRAMSPPLLLGDFYQTVAWKGGASPWKKRLYLENFNRTSKGWTFSVQDNGP